MLLVEGTCSSSYLVNHYTTFSINFLGRIFKEVGRPRTSSYTTRRCIEKLNSNISRACYSSHLISDTLITRTYPRWCIHKESSVPIIPSNILNSSLKGIRSFWGISCVIDCQISIALCQIMITNNTCRRERIVEGSIHRDHLMGTLCI